MANKQTAVLSKNYTNLCEINTEYPCLKKSTERHLNTSEPLKVPENPKFERLVSKTTSEPQEKDLKLKHPVKQQTELIELFSEEIHSKSNRKSRNRVRDPIDDNTNES